MKEIGETQKVVEQAVNGQSESITVNKGLLKGQVIQAERLVHERMASTLEKVEIESIICSEISDRDWYLIKEFGWSAGALLIQNFAWEVAAKLAGQDTLDYRLETIKLEENDQFRAHLSRSETEALSTIALAYRLTIDQNTYSKNTTRNISP